MALTAADPKDDLTWYNIDFSLMDQVTLMKTDDGALYIEYKDIASGNDVSTKDYAAKPMTEATTYYATAKVNVRDIPDQNGNKLGSLAQYDAAEVLGDCGNWVMIRFDKGYGYVSKNYLALSEEDAKAGKKIGITAPASSSTSSSDTYYDDSYYYDDSSYYDDSYYYDDSSYYDDSYYYDDSSYSEPTSSGPSVVSQEYIESCDGNGGSTIITYDDGFTEIVQN